MQSPIRMIASDIDGTLLRSDGTMSAYTVEIIHRAQQQGVLFTVCSGRYPEHADVILKAYGVRCPIAGNNGATLWDAQTDTVLCDRFLSSETALRACEIAEEIGLHYMVFGRKSVAARYPAAAHSSQTNYGAALRQDYHIVFEAGWEAVQAAVRRPVNKYYFHYDTEAEKSRLVSALGLLDDISITTSGPLNVEIIPRGCDKAVGVSEMARMHGIPLAQVMTLGDYENDISMLQLAGWGVAMGNASVETKRQADAVTDTNDADGVAKAIERYVLDG